MQRSVLLVASPAHQPISSHAFPITLRLQGASGSSANGSQTGSNGSVAAAEANGAAAPSMQLQGSAA